MNPQDFVEQLLALPDPAAQRRFLEEHTPSLDDQVANALRERAKQFLHADASRSLQIADLLQHAGELTGDPCYKAQGLLVEANVRCIGGLGEYQKALDLYNQAADIYRANGRLVEQARSQIGKLYALACLGRYAEALETGEWAGHILEEHAQWLLLAHLTQNLGVLQGRVGEDAKALALFDRAWALYKRSGPEGESELPWIDQNRSILLRNLGQFEASIQTSQRAEEKMAALGLSAEAARARQNLAVTYFVLGRYNEALKLLDEVRDIFLDDGRKRDAILVELFISDCLLQLRRFADVLEKCSRARDRFTEMGARFEVAQASLDEATALAGLQKYELAHQALAAARQIFIAERNSAWQAYTDLEEAMLLYRQARYEASDQLAMRCVERLRDLHLPLKQTQAQLVAARAALALNQTERAQELVRQALAVAQEKDVPALAYRCHHVQGQLALASGDQASALAAYAAAIRELERLQGRIMVEFRADFLEDKEEVYADAIALCLDAGNPSAALDYAERAKSRALLSLLSHRIDLKIEARSPQDRPLVAQLLTLREKRDRLYRRWETSETPGSDADLPADQQAGETARQEARRDILTTEDEIRQLWHRLLVHNAAYAHDASLWQVHTRLEQARLGPDTLLVEYFTLADALVVFLVSAERITACRLPITPQAIVQQQQHLRHNFDTLRQVPHLARQLTKKAQQILHRLYQDLVEPFAAQLEPYRQLIVVPHGPLHYLPFHALFDGRDYLLCRYQFSYLPGSSFISLDRPEASGETEGLVMGHTHQGRLPHVPAEAEAVARSLHATPHLDAAATRRVFDEQAPRCRIIHLATHGEFRPDNPLFSGLALADGWLTTLDIFNLRLKASLVTLSACQTGRNVVAGGDELLGLTRAFLYSGATSLVLSLWTVEDRSTTELMEAFYQELADGRTKGQALRQAQLRFLRGRDEGSQADRGHPYFWAPFFLVGNSGSL